MRQKLGLCVFLVCGLAGAERPALTGSVTDSAGNPLSHATVMVYQARVKQGYSTVCPTCYRDCGKRTLTRSDGAFEIAGVSPELLFDLLVAHEGYNPALLQNVDPAKGAIKAPLTPRRAIADPTRIVRGAVVDARGQPVRDALVQPQGIQGKMPNGRRGSAYGALPGLEPLAVTNHKGEFELRYTEPFEAMAVKVEARSLAPKIVTNLAVGVERHLITMTEGATIRGRLVQGGKPVADAEVALTASERRWGGNLEYVGYPLPEIRIGTRKDGTFAITNVPPGVQWYVYGRMETLASLGGSPAVECTTSKDGQEIDLGDLALMPSVRLRGKIVLKDGKRLPPGMRVTISPQNWPDSQTVILAQDGSFEFVGLAKGDYVLSPAVKGYEAVRAPLTMATNVNDYVLALNQ